MAKEHMAYERAVGVGVALKMKDPDARRAVLRRCAHVAMEGDWSPTKASKLAAAIGRPECLLPAKTRSSVAGLRDALSPEALVRIGMNATCGSPVVYGAYMSLEKRFTALEQSIGEHVMKGGFGVGDAVDFLCKPGAEKAGMRPGFGNGYIEAVAKSAAELALATHTPEQLARLLSDLGVPASAVNKALDEVCGLTGALYAASSVDADAPFSVPVPSSPAVSSGTTASVTPSVSTPATEIATMTKSETTTTTTKTETEVTEATATAATTEAAVTSAVAAITPPVGATPAINPAEFELPAPKPGTEVGINMMLEAAGMPKLEEIQRRVAKLTSAVVDAERTIGARIAEALRQAAAATPLEASSDGRIPEGKVVYRKAADVFSLSGPAAASFNFDVPTFVWAGPHPDVPERDTDYVFRPPALITLLRALTTNKIPWIYGHTGCGKSTLVAQVCSALGWPLMRVNFDSEVTRADLVGTMSLATDPSTGKTVTKFLDGILPLALSRGYVLLLDEIDFVRPDVSYVLQRALEGDGVVITEDGGRHVKPHPMSRIVATANTVGLGDEHGMYQGARPQSRAFLDRFSTFTHIPYLDAKNERALILKRVPTLDPKDADMIAQYVTEHRQAFENAEIAQPLSPRGIVNLAEQYVFFLSVYPDKKKAFARAFEDVVSARSDSSDGAVIKGLLNRVFK